MTACQSSCGTPVTWFTGVWPDSRIEHVRRVTEYDRDGDAQQILREPWWRGLQRARKRAAGLARRVALPRKTLLTMARWAEGHIPPSHTLREPLPVLTLALTRNFGCAVAIHRRLWPLQMTAVRPRMAPRPCHAMRDLSSRCARFIEPGAFVWPGTPARKGSRPRSRIHRSIDRTR